MRFAAVSAALLALCNNVLAAPAQPEPANLDVTLSQVDNTRLKAVVKNSGSEEVTFVHLNFFKDNAPVQKVALSRDGTDVEFEGVRSIYQQEDLEAESLTTLAAGASIDDEFDIASIYDMTPGGTYSVRSEGLVHTVTGNKVTGFSGFASNELSIDVDGANVASTVSKDFNPLERRANIARCYGSRGSALKQALENSAVISRQAAQAALTGSAQRFQEYFATTDPSVRQVVSARFQAIAQESSSFTYGATDYYCSDPLGYCGGNILAYTLPSRNLIANCNIYYTYLPAVSYQCHAQDQATTTLHEFCHAPGVYSPATRDVAYGYQAATSLSTRQALNNADSFALYANDVFLGC